MRLSEIKKKGIGLLCYIQLNSNKNRSWKENVNYCEYVGNSRSVISQGRRRYLYKFTIQINYICITNCLINAPRAYSHTHTSAVYCVRALTLVRVHQP